MTARISALASIILFWLPLAATWFMMAVEGPVIASVVARMPEAVHNLAAYGVATSLAWLIESPIMMLLSAATALVRDRFSYLALRRFAFLLNGIVTVGMLMLALPDVFTFVGERMIGLPPEIARLAHTCTTILILWPAAIGYRRFYQGILVRHHLTRRVAYGTAIRLGTMSITAAALSLTVSIPGSAIGAIALLTGVVFEAAASRWMANGVVRELMQNEETAAGALLELRAIWRFYFPLALTSILSMALGPLVTFGLGRGAAPIASLAVWPVVNSTAFLFRSGGVAFQEVGIALAGTGKYAAAEIRRAGMWLGGLATAAMALMALTPLERIWFENVAGLSPELADVAVWPVRVLILLPALEYLLSMQRARWILERRTGVITIATATEAGALAIALAFGVGVLNLVGALAAAFALLTGRLVANGYLFAHAQASSKA